MKSGQSTPYSRCQGRWRKRPNHELEFLRQQAIDLEEELEVLRLPDTEILTSIGALQVGDNETWQDVAARQTTQADAALKENLKLRDMLERQLREANALEHAIDQRWKKASREKRWFTGEPGQLQATDLSDELLYALLEENLASMHASVDKVLEVSEVARMNYDFCPNIQVQQDAEGVSFHHRAVRLLPFPLSNVVHALNNSLSLGDSGHPMARCRKLWKDDNHLQATTIVKLQLPSARQVEVTARLVHRAFPETSRTVFVWAAYVEIQGSMFVRLEEKGWVELEPYQFKKKAPGTILRSVVRVAPMLQFSSDEEEKQHVDELTDIVINTYNRNFGILYQVLENVMLDYSMNQA
ncbi:hypothetical protein PHMEG_00039682 [Phytophthora megakarya]|uniref:M96 mating-specific protein n=1 Tax=Phytophthora megakarya TaxID=4795 RepID=A0A225UFE2_9STRA|nr:hypothetical protein PHMEG_00039682 [Phytophthora megakarya]